MDTGLNFSAHARTMMHERMIREEWIIRTIENPDSTEERSAF